MKAKVFIRITGTSTRFHGGSEISIVKEVELPEDMQVLRSIDAGITFEDGMELHLGEIRFDR